MAHSSDSTYDPSSSPDAPFSHHVRPSPEHPPSTSGGGCMIILSFTPPAARPQVTKAEYNQAVYNARPPGDGATVRYLPEDLFVTRLEL